MHMSVSNSGCYERSRAKGGRRKETIVNFWAWMNELQDPESFNNLPSINLPVYGDVIFDGSKRNF